MTSQKGGMELGVAFPCLECVLEHAECLVTQRDLRTLDAPGPHHNLALCLSSAGPFKFLSMENRNSLPHFRIGKS